MIPQSAEVDSHLRTLAFESSDFDELKELSRHDHWGIRWKVARNPNCPLEILRELADDVNEHVIFAVLNHKTIENEEALSIFKENEKKLMKMINQCSNHRKIKFLLSSSDSSSSKTSYKESIYNYILTKYSKTNNSFRFLS